MKRLCISPSQKLFLTNFCPIVLLSLLMLWYLVLNIKFEIVIVFGRVFTFANLIFRKISEYKFTKNKQDVCISDCVECNK